MAVFYIAEFTATGRDITGRATQVPMHPPIAEQTVAIGGGSVQSAAFNVKTTLIRIHTDAICSFLVGANPTVAATNARMAAGTTEYIAVDKQRDVDGTPAALKIAVITNT